MAILALLFALGMSARPLRLSQHLPWSICAVSSTGRPLESRFAIQLTKERQFGRVGIGAHHSHPVFDSCHPIRPGHRLDRYGGLTGHRPRLLRSTDMNSTEWNFRGLKHHHPASTKQERGNTSCTSHSFFFPRIAKVIRQICGPHNAAKREGKKAAGELDYGRGFKGRDHDVEMGATAEPRTARCTSMQGTRSPASTCKGPQQDGKPAFLRSGEEAGYLFMEPWLWLFDHPARVRRTLPRAF